MSERRKEIHLSLTIGPSIGAGGANLTIDWGPEDNDKPVGSAHTGTLSGAVADTSGSVTIESGLPGKVRTLTIPAFNVSQKEDILRVHWTDHNQNPAREGNLLIPLVP
jgi:hypothetical protein